uniref:UDP-glucuronosyltransferase n=1 Tax=Culicoides sonorensis TaxID=179676 RepID=A0A336MIZ6_CULSO
MQWQNLISGCFISWLAMSHQIETYRILAIFPTPSISHQVVFRPVMQELATRGHHITLLTPNPFEATENITIIDLNHLYEDWKKIDFAETADLNPFAMIELLLTVMRGMMTKILEIDEVKPILHGNVEKFDVVISEFLGYTPMYAFAHLYNVPLIGMTSLDMSPSEHASIGNLVHPILHPHLIFPFYGDLNFFERVASVYMSWIMDNIFTPMFGRKLDQVIFKYFGDSYPNSYELTRSVSLAIVNAHPALGFTRPIVPTTIQVGLLHIQPPKPLPSDIDSYMSKSKHGVIYFSLGSNVKSSCLKKNHFDTFLGVFKELEYDIIWKFENETMQNKPNNVMIRKWLPQQDLLAHPNLKLFITHGGQQSMEEAIDRGIPLLCIPFFGDQETNSKKIEHLGIGRRLLLADLNPINFKALVHEVINHAKYKQKIIELRDVVKDSPLSPKDMAAWWIEYTIRHNGTRHLRYPGLGFPNWKYYFVDVIIFTITILSIFCVLIFISIRKLLKYCKFIKKDEKKIKVK